MKPFTVIWEFDAIDELTVLWNTAADAAERNALTRASHQIDSLLRATGGQAGTVVAPEGIRGITVGLLRVLFVYSEADCMVRVLQARRLT